MPQQHRRLLCDVSRQGGNLLLQPRAPEANKPILNNTQKQGISGVPFKTAVHVKPLFGGSRVCLVQFIGLNQCACVSKGASAMHFFTSLIDGIAGMAPFLVVVRLPAALPNFIISLSSSEGSVRRRLRLILRRL